MAKTRERKRERTEQGSGLLKWALDLLRGGLLGFAVSCAALGVAALLIWGGLLGNGKTDSAVVAACLLGGFAGGAFAVGPGKKAPLPLGVGTGSVLWLMIFAAGALLYQEEPLLSSMGVTAGACLCGGGLAGLLGGAGKGRRRK